MTFSPARPDLPGYRAKLDSVSPAHAWKTVRELVLDGREDALTLAAEFAEIAEPSTDKLLKLWPEAPDPDGFAELLLGPAFTREGRTTLELRRRETITGVRHLTMLRTLRLDHCKHLTDLSDLAALTGLFRLELDGCAAVTDLTPLSGLPVLKTLILRSSRALTDITPLLTLRTLRHLDLRSSGVTSVEGVGDAFPTWNTSTSTTAGR
ncbi:leucine-rich repeat domain-containing protein [Nonomuraea recticatena]|uniref:hypothetical protein n=1 Tax=Nonomuraea recticatena TaxID=46178 RepID=UPI003616CB68